MPSVAYSEQWSWPVLDRREIYRVSEINKWMQPSEIALQPETKGRQPTPTHTFQG